MNKLMFTIMLTLVSVKANAVDHYVITTGQKVQLLCQIFAEEKYFCKDLTSGKDAGSNVLILTKTEVTSYGGLPFKPNQRALELLAN